MEEEQIVRPSADISELTQLAEELKHIGDTYGDEVREQVMWILYRSALSKPELTPDAVLFDVLKNDARKAEYRKKHPNWASDIGEMAA